MIDITTNDDESFFIITISGNLTGEQLAEELVGFYERPDLEPNADYLWDLRGLNIEGAFHSAIEKLTGMIAKIKTENPSVIHVAFLTGSAETKSLATWYTILTAQPSIKQELFDDEHTAIEWLKFAASKAVSH